MTGLALSLLLTVVTGLPKVQVVAPIKCIDVSDTVISRRMLPIAVTEEGQRLLVSGSRAFLNVRFTGSLSAPPSSSSTTRFLQGTPPQPPRTEFLFTRDGKYVVTLHSAPRFAWPNEDATGTRVPGCAEQSVQVIHLDVGEYEGVRGHGWAGVRLLTSVEAEGGASVFFGRLGFAGTVSVTAFGDPENRWVPGVDVRWRGARGYLGGGVRYFHREEPDHEHWRPVFVAGQELPPFKGLPTWFVLDIRVDQYQQKFWRGLDVSFGLRMDFTGNRP